MFGLTLLLLLQLAWAYVMSLWVAAHGDELGRGVVAAMVPWFVICAAGVAGTLLVISYMIAAVRRSLRRHNSPVAPPGA
jgi:hypothetical protein